MERLTKNSTFEVRKRAIEALLGGMGVGQVSMAYGIDRTTLYRWSAKYEEGGVEGLYRRGGSGRPRANAGEGNLLPLVLSSPLDSGFESDLWTVARIHQVLTSQESVQCSKMTIWRRLVEAGLTYQKPERRYYESDDEARMKWRRYEIPKIRRCLAKNRAILYFLDESNVALTPCLGKTWSVRGTTPQAVVTGNRGSISAISAISPKNLLVFRVYERRITSGEVIEFLEQMLRHHSRRHIAVVMDRATPHTSKRTRDFIESEKRLHVFHTPSYSPDWNPDEKVWNHLKNCEQKSHQAKTIQELKILTEEKLQNMSCNPKLLRGIYFRCCVADLLL